ncbi:C-type lectin BpLec-like [Cyprinodon tularosa]|uniref:C-type lectin BpLec-like n=1 Tax=Cyprinodon tularosa TaxID=77115 RepID=UPI0018E1E967|nr:C-type lectin BpLec-like [Cyprinodon tularosa]
MYSVCFDGKKQGADQYILSPIQMSWTAARDFCRKNHTDLVSLRNDAEYQTVKDVSNGHAVYVGLFRDRWEWSDMTESSFRYWQETQPVHTTDSNDCIALLKSKFGKWGDRLCTEKHPFLCNCKTDHFLHFIKLRISPQVNSMLDLQDRAVQNNILKQIRLKIIENIPARITLQWRNNSDGKVFIKQPAVNIP